MLAIENLFKAKSHAILKKEVLFSKFERSQYNAVNGANSKALKFELSVGFKVFDENYNHYKPLEIIENSSYKYSTPVFVFPGWEGKLKFVHELVQNLSRKAYCFQYPFEKSSTNISLVAESIIPSILQHAHPGQKLNIIAHSFGGLMALKALSELQSLYTSVRLCLTDSTPFAIKWMTAASFGDINNKDRFEDNLLTDFLKWMKINDFERFQVMLKQCKNWDDKLDRILNKVPEHPRFNKQNLRIIVDGFYRTLRTILLYDENFEKLDVKATLIRSSIKILPFPDDFNAQIYFKKPINTMQTDGHHFNMLRYQRTANLINMELET